MNGRRPWTWREVIGLIAMVLFIAATTTVFMLFFIGMAHADPVCDAPGVPACAPPADPAQQCAVIAWRTFTPCNWWGVKVPTGTPGSWG